MRGRHRCRNRADASVPRRVRRCGATVVAYGSDERDDSGASSGAATLQDAGAGRGRDAAAARLLYLNLEGGLRCVAVDVTHSRGCWSGAWT